MCEQNAKLVTHYMSGRQMTRMDNSAVTCNDFMSFEWQNMASESTRADSEGSVFQVLEGVV